MNKYEILSWSNLITVLLGTLGYIVSILYLKDDIFATLWFVIIFCLLVPQWLAVGNMPLRDIVISTAVIWLAVVIVSITYLLFTGEIYHIAIVNKIICYYTCPR